MNNKVSRAEKFLWSLHKIYEVVGDVLNIPPRNIYDAIYPECKKLRKVWQKRKEEKSFVNLVFYLKKRGLIKEFTQGKEKAWLLTKTGEERILRIEPKFKNYKKRKDGKWIMVIFDVPEKMRRKRDLFRCRLKSLGFRMLQESIWVCPFDVMEDTNNFINKFLLASHIKIFLIEEIQIN